MLVFVSQIGGNQFCLADPTAIHMENAQLSFGFTHPGLGRQATENMAAASQTMVPSVGTASFLP